MRFLFVVTLTTCSFVLSAQTAPKHIVGLAKELYNNEVVNISKCSCVNIEKYNIKTNGLWIVKSNTQVKSAIAEIEVKGRAHTFSCLVVTEPNGDVVSIKIINYPSPHGVQVTNKKWLSQLRKKHHENYLYGQNINALSGATISAKNLIAEIEKLRNFIKLEQILIE